ncbi:chitobiase/beta-hexosaminidase C-terminal domain-containing protein [Yeosuana marina]|uniref:chitobiase/beta-hexosaminidase C-terminal domain-containing protein n=1 Tax=Yeosuana marina TaxID=1565536 RepID=UPI0030C7D47A
MNIKKQILLIISLFFFGISYASNAENVPRAILAIGRFHPVILHLPIGALLLTFFLDIVGRIKKNYPKNMIRYALGFSAFFSIIACVLGYFLSLEGGYSEKTLDLHFWTGILSATLITVLFLLSSKEGKLIKRLFFLLFLATIICISVAGHFGSILTHGDNFLTEYIKTPNKAKTITQIDSLHIYNNVVLKIFDDKCIQCHNSTKNKGDLSLISKEAISLGGKSGEIIKSGNADESLLYEHIKLPISDKKHMPPEGKPQLTKDEVWIIKYWIDHSKTSDDKVVNIAKNDTLNNLLKNYLVVNEQQIEEASVEDILEVEEAGFSVRKLVPNKPELWVKFKKGTITKNSVETLTNLKEQITELDLSNSSLSDDMTNDLKKLKNLKKLELNNTYITDKSLKNIDDLNHLSVLNIVNTQITDKGLENLFTYIKPKHIYAWKTNVNYDIAENIENKYDVDINVGIVEGFVDIPNIIPPILLTKKTLFTDTLSIKLESKLKNSTIYYTVNGDEPDTTSLKYTNPILIDSTTHIAFKVFKKGWLPSEILKKDFYKIKYHVSDYSIVYKPESQYSGPEKLFDMELGSENFKDDKWTGFLGKDINATANLGDVKSISHITVNCLGKSNDWILFPTQIIVSTSLNKTSGFKEMGTLKINEDNKNDMAEIKKFTVNIPETKAQYVKVEIKNPKVLPNWHEGAGNASWIFVDEIYLW